MGALGEFLRRCHKLKGHLMLVAAAHHAWATGRHTCLATIGHEPTKRVNNYKKTTIAKTKPENPHDYLKPLLKIVNSFRPLHAHFITGICTAAQYQIYTYIFDIN